MLRPRVADWAIYFSRLVEARREVRPGIHVSQELRSSPHDAIWEPPRHANPYNVTHAADIVMA